jgi:hypothetical protein
MKTAGWRDHLRLLGGRRFSGDMPTEIRVALATEENFLQHSVPLSFLSAASRASCPEIVSSGFPSGREVEESLFMPALTQHAVITRATAGIPDVRRFRALLGGKPEGSAFRLFGCPTLRF